MVGWQLALSGMPRFRVLKPLIFRLTPRGLDLLRVLTDGSEAISARMLSSHDFRCSGGNSDGGGKTALEDAYGVNVGQILGRLARGARGLDHHAPDGGMGDHQGIELLQD